jgi:hypothetical protein
MLTIQEGSSQRCRDLRILVLSDFEIVSPSQVVVVVVVVVAVVVIIPGC